MASLTAVLRELTPLRSPRVERTSSSQPRARGTRNSDSTSSQDSSGVPSANSQGRASTRPPGTMATTGVAAELASRVLKNFGLADEERHYERQILSDAFDNVERVVERGVVTRTEAGGYIVREKHIVCAAVEEFFKSLFSLCFQMPTAKVRSASEEENATRDLKDFYSKESWPIFFHTLLLARGNGILDSLDLALLEEMVSTLLADLDRPGMGDLSCTAPIHTMATDFLQYLSQYSLDPFSVFVGCYPSAWVAGESYLYSPIQLQEDSRAWAGRDADGMEEYFTALLQRWYEMRRHPKAVMSEISSIARAMGHDTTLQPGAMILVCVEDMPADLREGFTLKLGAGIADADDADETSDLMWFRCVYARVIEHKEDTVLWSVDPTGLTMCYALPSRKVRLIPKAIQQSLSSLYSTQNSAVWTTSPMKFFYSSVPRMVQNCTSSFARANLSSDDYPKVLQVIADNERKKLQPHCFCKELREMSISEKKTPVVIFDPVLPLSYFKIVFQSWQLAEEMASADASDDPVLQNLRPYCTGRITKELSEFVKTIRPQTICLGNMSDTLDRIDKFLSNLDTTVDLHFRLTHTLIRDHMNAMCERVASILSEAGTDSNEKGRKSEISNWWLEFIGTQMEDLLERQGFVFDVIPHNYMDEPPLSIGDVRHNLIIIRQCMSFRAEGVVEKLQYIHRTTYTVVDRYLEDVSDILREKLFSDFSYNSSEPQLLRKLEDDLAYLNEMKEMDDLVLEKISNRSTNPTSKLQMTNVVPILGVSMARLHIQESEHATVLEVWAPKNCKPPGMYVDEMAEDTTESEDVSHISPDLLRAAQSLYATDNMSSRRSTLHLSSTVFGQRKFAAGVGNRPQSVIAASLPPSHAFFPDTGQATKMSSRDSEKQMSLPLRFYGSKGNSQYNSSTSSDPVSFNPLSFSSTLKAAPLQAGAPRGEVTTEARARGEEGPTALQKKHGRRSPLLRSVTAPNLPKREMRRARKDDTAFDTSLTLTAGDTEKTYYDLETLADLETLGLDEMELLEEDELEEDEFECGGFGEAGSYHAKVRQRTVADDDDLLTVNVTEPPESLSIRQGVPPRQTSGGWGVIDDVSAPQDGPTPQQSGGWNAFRDDLEANVDAVNIVKLASNTGARGFLSFMSSVDQQRHTALWTTPKRSSAVGSRRTGTVCGDVTPLRDSTGKKSTGPPLIGGVRGNSFTDDTPGRAEEGTKERKWGKGSKITHKRDRRSGTIVGLVRNRSATILSGNTEGSNGDGNKNGKRDGKNEEPGPEPPL